MLDGRKFVVAGGLGALGSSVVEVLEGYGAQVVAVDARDSGGSSPVGPINLNESGAALHTLVHASDHMGGLNGVVNVVGSFAMKGMAYISLEDWDALYQANLRVAASLSQAAAKYASDHREFDRLVHTGAAAAKRGGARLAAYTAMKAGIERLTEAFADEAKDSITVNAVLPGTIDTPANRQAMPDAEFSRWVKPNQIGELVAFLVSARASAVTGACIPIVGRS